MILAFSGGGTRAAAFSYGVLEFLRRTEVVGPAGHTARLLDEVNVITGVSGGSFTALAYGLYGDKLFTDYERRFLKRNVQGEIIARTFSPRNWGNLWSLGWGRSELAAQLYDEVLFDGATFGDLDRGRGPLILASATDISTGARFVFNQSTFDIICSDLNAVPLSRAAAASSGGAGGALASDDQQLRRHLPYAHARLVAAVRRIGGTATAGGASDPLAEGHAGLRRRRSPALPASRGRRCLRQCRQCARCSTPWKSRRPCTRAGAPTPLDSARRIIVFIVNSLSSPPTNWDKSEIPPGTLNILLKSAGVPIDRYSYEAIELLRDVAARWQTLRLIGNSAAMAANRDPAVAAALRVPNAEIYAIDVSFAALKDKDELAYLNEQPTSFVLPDEAVDRLRAAAGNDHHGLAGIPAPAEGRRGENRD
ncbi:MAG: patatin-like phospholipase family protein [Candidatus Accumulibacter propinquus]